MLDLRHRKRVCLNADTPPRYTVINQTKASAKLVSHTQTTQTKLRIIALLHAATFSSLPDALHRRPVICLRSEASYASDQIV